MNRHHYEQKNASRILLFQCAAKLLAQAQNPVIDAHAGGVNLGTGVLDSQYLAQEQSGSLR